MVGNDSSKDRQILSKTTKKDGLSAVSFVAYLLCDVFYVKCFFR